MAVYTHVSATELQSLLAGYDLGTLVSFSGIEGGIENSNYFVTLHQHGQHREYVLTLFEELDHDELPFFIELCDWLYQRGQPVPHALRDSNGRALQQLQSRPALLQPRLPGEHLDTHRLTPSHCHQIGAALARFHLAGADFPHQRQAHRGVFWWRREAPRVAPHLDQEQAQLLLEQVAEFDQLRAQQRPLPQGIIHGDLFPDNALFEQQQLSAILDIYNAASGWFIYDLAVLTNAWCQQANGQIDLEREQALLQGYQEERILTSDERDAWPIVVRTAAMRFWLSRLIPWLGLTQANRADGQMRLKDPAPYLNTLRARRTHPAQI